MKQDTKRIKNSLDRAGYYFATVDSQVKKNSNDTVDLIFDIDLGKKFKISKIEFTEDKKIKNRTLRSVIISEENKFWKFISKNNFNKNIIESDKRLLKTFYLNKGYYDVQIESSSVNYFDDNAKALYKINAGERYIINKASLELPIDYNKSNFNGVTKALNKLVNKAYSFNKISKVVDEIDKLSREYDFINAEIIENKIDDNKMIDFKS